MREWHKKHPEYAKKKHKEWAKSHPNYFKEQAKIFDLRHPGRRREMAKKWLAKHPEYLEKRKPKKRIADMLYSRKRRQKVDKGEEYRIWRTKNPEKYKAHWILNSAITTGEIKRRPCETCGEKRKYHVHAHHDDYTKPLEVKWLCVIHHKAVHK